MINEQQYRLNTIRTYLKDFVKMGKSGNSLKFRYCQGI